MSERIGGHGTRKGTSEYAERFSETLPMGHFSDYPREHLKLSSLGVGTFPGAVDEATDHEYAGVVAQALQSGINVVDTGANYRYGRSIHAVGRGIRAAHEAGLSREAMFVISKGGFLTFPEGRPENLDTFIATEIASKGLGEAQDVAEGVHLMSPEYLEWQLEASLKALGLETLDVFLVDQPEIHIPAVGKERMHRKLLQAFIYLESAVRAGKIRHYGISSFHAFRVETDNTFFQSITGLLGLAEKAAGEGQKHHLKVIEMPFNPMVLEGYTRFSQITGRGNLASTVQAAVQLGLHVIATHCMGKGRLAQQEVPAFAPLMPELANPAQRAMQFARSTPGIGTSLVGLPRLAYLADMLACARVAPVEKAKYLTLYQRVSD